MKDYCRSLLVVFIASFSFFACGNAQDRGTKNATPPVKEASESRNQATPAKMLGNIPVYDTFNSIEPIFTKDNDTTYVINFWATWCKPCVEELPYFEQLTEEMKGQKVKVVLVSLDFPKQLETKLVPFVEKQQLKSDVVVLTDGKFNDWIDRVDSRWTGAIPITIIYNADQREFIGEQFANYEELKGIVEKLL